MVVASLYTIVDGLFVGRLVGEMALGAVNIVYPYLILQFALTTLIATGGANLVSFYKGAGQEKPAINVFRQSTVLLLAAGLALSFFALTFTEKLCVLLGAEGELLPYAIDYLKYMSVFSSIQTMSMGFGIFLRNDGSPGLAVAASLTASLANIILDYIFIGPFGWGVKGAAIATGIGIAFELLICSIHFICKRGILRLGIPRFHKHEVKKLLTNGMASFLIEFSQSAIIVSYNIAISATLGATGIAAYSIVMYICETFNMILIGITDGAQPLMSYRHGSGEPGQVKFLYKLGRITCIGITIAFFGACVFFGGPLINLFITGTSDVTFLAQEMMRLYFMGYFPIGITMMNILFFQTTEREFKSNLLSIMRCVGFLQVFLFTLPRFLGPIGLYLAFLCGEACNCLVSILMVKLSGKYAGQRRFKTDDDFSEEKMEKSLSS
jgi:putative MATE family efflux protein